MWIPRLDIVISEETWHKRKKYIPHGMTKPVFTNILERLLDMVEKDGLGILAAICDGNFTITGGQHAKAEGSVQEHHGDELGRGNNSCSTPPPS